METEKEINISGLGADPLSPRNVLGVDYDKWSEPVDIPFSVKVREVLSDLAVLLNEKNKKYGNSALEPKRIFSKASSVEQLFVRLDDKLSRIANRQDNEDEDVITDLMGYLVLLKIALEENSKNS